MTPTKEQYAIITAKGDTIVSASAGSGKTTVMIERLVQKIIADKLSLENILAVTFTKKAAANMKDKLRERLGEAIASVGDIVAGTECVKESAEELSARLVREYDLVATADISTIDSFCLKLVKNYFYELGCDANSEIADDDAVSKLYADVFDGLFNGEDGEGGYYGKRDENGKIENEAFSTLLTYLRQNRRDDSIKRCIIDAYTKVRSIDDYANLLTDIEKSAYSEAKFEELYSEYKKNDEEIYRQCLEKIDEFKNTYDFGAAQGAYNANYKAMKDFLNAQNRDEPEKYCKEYKAPDKIKQTDLTAAGVILDDDTKKRMNEYGTEYTKLKNSVSTAYNDKIATKGKRSHGDERAAYLQAAEISKAFIRCLLDFDRAYADAKKAEGKLDYGDLEQYAIRLLGNEDIRNELNEKYRLIFVDEFQDVNHVQNKILSYLSGEKFYVGDQKQAIYAFRGSDSAFFSDIFDDFKKYAEGGDKNALTLNTNFRSEREIIDKVNDAFRVSMTKEICDMEYKGGHEMKPREDATDGRACLRPFGKSSSGERSAPKIYSVKEAAIREKKQSKDKRMLEVIEEYLHPAEGKSYNEGDICVLCRFNSQVQSVTKLLEKNGYTVSGGEEDNILENSEIRQILDILSYIDDSEQNMPLITAMLSPLGDFTEKDLAAIRVADEGAKTYRECVRKYGELHDDDISRKISAFDEKIDGLKKAAEILSAGTLIDKILLDTGIELKYSHSPDKLRRLSLLAAEGEDTTLSAFLKEMSAGDAKISMPSCAGSDGIKIMTMHAAKGLQFPVVIIYDASYSFVGNKSTVYLFDERLGFAFNSYDDETMTSEKTLLWRRIEEKQKTDDIKQELNLFYVACTRAKERLDIMVAEDKISKNYDLEEAKQATNYAKLIDLNRFGREDDKGKKEPEAEGAKPEAEPEAETVEEPTRDDEAIDVGGIQMEDTVPHEEKEDETILRIQSEFAKKVGTVFEKNYTHEYSNSPAKTTVSEAVREDEAKARRMYDESAEYENLSSMRADGAAPSDVGTAYHKFLELCDFTVRDAAGIESEIERFFAEGKMTKSQKDILLNDLKEGDDVGPVETVKRVYGKIYSKGVPKRMYRERRFLCNLPAKIVYGNERRDKEANTDREDSQDEVLVQGIMDLLVQYEDGSWRIIDYKHSTKGMDALWETYGKQLELYIAATLKILSRGRKECEGPLEIDKELVNINPRKKVKNA